MEKSNVTHTFHGGTVPILRSAIAGDRVDYRAMLARIRWRNCWLHANTTAAQAVDLELSTGRTMRELYEANNSFPPLA